MKNGENVTGCAVCARLDALLAEAAVERNSAILELIAS
jgi:hypothetical protein